MKMEFSEISVKDSPGLCRCCLSEGCYKDMGTEYTWMNETEVYADMLLDCFDVGITQHNDGPNGPKRLICEVCITRLRDACNFKKQVLDSEKKFIDMLGRGEFRSKVLIYQDQLKSEAVEVSLDDMDTAAEVEYLDDIDFQPDDMEPLSTIKRELPSSSSTDAPRKRGRPRKDTTEPQEKKIKKTDVKKTKITKEILKYEEKDTEEQQKKEEYIKLMSLIIENSTIMPFRWHCGRYACFFCCCPFEDSSKLKQHYREEHSDAKVRKVFRSIIKNSKIKLEISNIVCKKCSREFHTVKDLLNHFAQTHDMKVKLEMESQLFTYKISDDKMSCHECGEEFRSFTTLLIHTHAKHNKTEKYICEICGNSFVSIKNVSSHIRTVHSNQNLNCEKCGLNFTTFNDLQLHNKQTHPSKLLKCSHCPEIFESFYRKKKHLDTVHGINPDKVYQCDICNHTFTVKSKMINHKLRVHLKEKHYQCSFCPYKAFAKEGLKKHMVSHDDSRPFQCEFCKKAFQRKKTYELHRRIHTNDRRYVCKECGKSFVQCTSLKLHYRVHHSKETPSWK